jgi:rifampicin phosphotransferase
MAELANQVGAGALVLPLQDVSATMLNEVGGKGANLGEMSNAGFPVPPGFCVTTTAYAAASSQAELSPLLDELAAIPASDIARQASLAATIRARLLDATMPGDIRVAITQAYQTLADGAPVAVRSSATAEDLPLASFAGQQDTYLNIVGADAVRDAVRRCWASLWTDRAVSYRASNQIDHRAVRLAVVIQRMVEAEVAGVLFTANPLTGARRQAVIDANPGLGEAVVSGAVNPDHFVVDTTSGEILERRLGDKRLVIRSSPGGGTTHIELAGQQSAYCLTDDQARALARLGAQVEAHYGAPQDTEWALDSTGSLWLTQARPITTLYPMPASAQAFGDALRVYLSANVIQGMYQPFTPMGLQTFLYISSALAGFATGKPRKNPEQGLPIIVDLGQRLFLDAAPILRDALGRDIIIQVLGGMEAQTATIFRGLAADPRLEPATKARLPTVLRLLPIALRTQVPAHVAQALLRPRLARRKLAHLVARLREPVTLAPGAGAAEQLTAFERELLDGMPQLARTVLPIGFAGIAASVIVKRLLGRIATPDEAQTILRALPHNPTTEMDLELWALAQRLAADTDIGRLVMDTPSHLLANAYRSASLPPALQQGLAGFLRAYGHRAVAEIDLGAPRWSDDPTHILGVLANYLRLTDPNLAPDTQFDRARREAEAMAQELTRRARRKGWLYERQVRFLLRRVRELTGTREYPKFCIILQFARLRVLLKPVGEELARAGRLAHADDIYFLTVPDARTGLVGQDLRSLVRERRDMYEREVGRRHIPRVLLSDGVEPVAALPASAGGANALLGSPASAGRITGRARVILNPAGARLDPGEILVAPSTDPGWTPLFLTAGGLVMEMGGSMSHGAVVAREYGIPAVVGVHGATERIATGRLITVDGSNGVVTIEPEESRT